MTQTPTLSVPVWTWRDAVRRAPVPPLTKLVCWALSNYLSDVGEGCFPGCHTLMADTGLSNTSLAKHLANAVAAGLLEIERVKDGACKFRRSIYLPRFPDTMDLARTPARNTRTRSERLKSEPETSDRIPSEGASHGKHRVKEVHTARPGEGASHGPCEPRGKNHVKLLHTELSTRTIQDSPLTPLDQPDTPTPDPTGSAGGEILSGNDLQDEDGAALPETVGWAKGWQTPTRRLVADLRRTVSGEKVGRHFLDGVCGLLQPPAWLDQAGYVRQLMTKLAALEAGALERLADRCIETRSRDLPPIPDLLAMAAGSAGPRPAAPPDPKLGGLLADLAGRLGQPVVDAWFAEVRFSGCADGLLSLTAPRPAALWIEREYGEALADAALAAFGVAAVVIEHRRAAA